MAENDLVKLLIAVTSAFAGWLLAQFTSIAKAWYQRFKIKTLLIEELKDLELESERLLFSPDQQESSARPGSTTAKPLK
jgi:hypothetical protein